MEALHYLWSHHAEILAAIGAIGVACEGGALALLAVAKILAGAAKLTGTDSDDRFLAHVIARLEAFIAWIPRLRQGAARKPMDPRGTALLALLLVGVTSIAGCASSPLQRHVIASTALDAVIEADAIAIERVIRLRVIAEVTSTCTDPATFEHCRDRVAYTVVARLARWTETHNSAAAGRDLYVAGLRESELDEPSLESLLDEATTLALQAVAAAQAYGIEIPIADLLEAVR